MNKTSIVNKSLFFRIFIMILLLLMTSCASVTRSSFEVPEEGLLTHLADAPEPVWKMPVKASEIEIAQLIDDHTLLMMTTRVGGFMQVWGVFYHEIVLSDIETGSVLWNISIETILSSIDELFATDDFIFIVGWDYSKSNQRLTALNRSDGTEAWTRLYPSHVIFKYDPAVNLIIGAGSADQSFLIKAIKPETGDPQWESTLDAAFARKESLLCDIFIRDGSCIIAGNRAVRLQMTDGEILWRTEIESGLHSNPVTNLTDSCLIFSSENSLGAYNLNEGKQKWIFQVPDGIILSRVTTDRFIFIAVEEDGRTSILCLDLENGKSLWQTGIEDSLRSSLSFFKGKLYLTNRSSLLSFDASTGKPNGITDLPDFMHSDFGLPDHILINEDTVTAVRESGLVAYNRASLELNYVHAVPGTEVYTYYPNSQRLLIRQIGKGTANSRIDSMGLTKALQNQVIRYNTGTSPQFAQGVPRTANQAQTEATMAAANMAASIAAAGVAFREEAVYRNMRINLKEINAARTCHKMSIQHGYFIRPFYREGWGVTLIRLSDGARAELYVSSPNIPLRINSGNFPLIFIDPEKQQLIVNGTGIEPDPSDTYTKVGFGKDVFKVWPGIPPTWIVPYTTVYAYDLNKLEFESDSSDPLPPTPPMLGENEQQLRDAILSRDRAGVNDLIAGGADVNAIDQAGLNSLFYAAVVDDKKITKVLITAGADATLRDPHGLLSYHYTFLTHGDNRSTMVFRKAVMNQEKAAKSP